MKIKKIIFANKPSGAFPKIRFPQPRTWMTLKPMGQLESALKSPFGLKEWLYKTPERTSGLAKEQTDE